MPNTFDVPHRTRWLILALFGVFALIQLVLGKWGGALQVVIAGLVMTGVIWLWVPILIRQLSDQHLFFLRVPEMSAAFIMRDRKVHCVIIAVSGKYRERFQNYKLEMEAADEGIEIKLIDPKHPMVYIGVPWIYTVHSWYERVIDEVNPSVDPKCFLDLSERTHDFHPSPVDTGDPIQVGAKLIASMIPWDPLKMIFGVKYFLEAFVAEVDARWRRVAATLHYFLYETDQLTDVGEGHDEKKGKGKRHKAGDDDLHEGKKPLVFDPEIYVNAHRRLLIDLWLFGCKTYFAIELDDEGLPHARPVEKEPDAVYWDVTQEVIRLGKKDLTHPVNPGLVPWDVYGDYGSSHFYVLQESGKFWFREGDSGDALLADANGIYWQLDAGNKVRKIQVKPHRRVLFVFDKDGDTWRGPQVFYKYGIPEDKAALRFYRDWGLVLKDLELRDIDPTDLRIRESLQKRLTARAEALQTRERAWGQQQRDILEGEGVKQRMILVATGQREKDILEGQGVMQRRTLEGEGEGNARRLAHEGDAAGFAAKLKSLGIEPGDESAVMPLIAEAMERVARATELMVMSGSQGGWSDVFGTVPALSKLWGGKGTPPSKTELIKALAGLNEAELRTVIEALPEARGGGGSAS